ncbi:MAG: hypothetical protein ABIJ97_08085 [Bacteroidota bacterium]
MSISLKYLIALLIVFLFNYKSFSQAVPTSEENIPYMITFGSKAEKTWGDDDFCQIFFYMVPKSSASPFYLRIFDPDTGGEIDEAKGDFDTKVKFSFYGGIGCFSNKDSKNVNPEGEYKSGNLIASKTFGNDSKYDNNWYNFGPFNPSEGEYVKQFDAYLFKVIAEGTEGNDGNLYSYFFSSDPNKNSIVEGGSTFTYEYSFRLSDQASHKSHIYPLIDDKTVSIQIYLFDWDNDGRIRLVSNSKNGQTLQLSGDGNWIVNTFDIVEEEKNSTFDIQFIKPPSNVLKNNNGVVYITNQYNEALPFFTTPIGGAPKYNYKINIEKGK